jgi:hypothetical protein
MSDRTGRECTNMNCHAEAEYAYWMPDLGQFSRVRSPEHDMLDDGDLAPYVCESCRDHMAGTSHWDGERFYRPEEKLVADGGTERCQSCGRDDLLDEADLCGPCADVADIHEAIIGYEKPHRTRTCWKDGCEMKGLVCVSEPKASIVRFVCEDHIADFVGYYEYALKTDEVHRVQEEVASEVREQGTNPPAIGGESA